MISANNVIINFFYAKLEYLRSLDERSKKMWVFILSGISTVFITTLWIFYLNITITQIPPSQFEQNQAAEVLRRNEENSESPLLANFKKNASLIYKNILNKVMGVTNRGTEIIILK